MTSYRPRQWNGPFTRALVLEDPDPSLDMALTAMGVAVDRIPDSPDEDTLVRILEEGQHNLIYKRSRIPITERVLAASQSLAAVMLCCIGDDSVDKQAAAKHGVMVMNDPVSNGRSVAELVIGELIVLSRRIFDSVSEMGRSVWRKNNTRRYEVMGKTLGILGLGKIGRQVGQLAQALGIKVVFHDTSLVSREVGEAMNWTPMDSVEALFGASDFVSVHVSATDTRGRLNEHIVTPEALAAMSSRSIEGPRIFINLARGLVVDDQVLRDAVTAGHVHYAITDVFPDEPGQSTTATWVNPYEGMPQIYATPHIGAATQEAQPRIASYVARTTQLFSGRGMLRNCVYEPRASIEFHEAGAQSMLVVVHADTRGTKKAVDDAIYNAGANNLRSAHSDFAQYGIAYDVSALDRTLTDAQCDELIAHACELTGDPHAIRWIRRIPLSEG
jgi:D-3-phosphoglycerate dehydrogenase